VNKILKSISSTGKEEDVIKNYIPAPGVMQTRPVIMP
jgi:hypothetical protein